MGKYYAEGMFFLSLFLMNHFLRNMSLHPAYLESLLLNHEPGNMSLCLPWQHFSEPWANEHVSLLSVYLESLLVKHEPMNMSLCLSGESCSQPWAKEQFSHCLSGELFSEPWASWHISLLSVYLKSLLVNHEAINMSLFSLSTLKAF